MSDRNVARGPGQVTTGQTPPVQPFRPGTPPQRRVIHFQPVTSVTNQNSDSSFSIIRIVKCSMCFALVEDVEADRAGHTKYHNTWNH